MTITVDSEIFIQKVVFLFKGKLVLNVHNCTNDMGRCGRMGINQITLSWHPPNMALQDTFLPMFAFLNSPLLLQYAEKMHLQKSYGQSLYLIM